MKFTRKHPAFVDYLYLVAALPLVLAACSKHAQPAADMAQVGSASVVQGSTAALNESTSAPSAAPASVQAVSDPGAASGNGNAGADAQEADESGTAAGTVMKIDTPSADGVTTPFGKLSVSVDNVLLLNGKPVNPHFEGNNSLSFVAQVALKNHRAVLVQNNGGAACPASYRWVMVSDGGYIVSPEFGSCSDLAKVSTVSETLVVTMPGFAGDSEPAAERKRAARTRMIYVYDGKTLTENGKPVSTQ
ncbi:hypothetical protein C7399_114160 [Paraburkholderia tropica]|uniref:Lipoprotein n=1 Tax=Paraburkholderia tropica TaxID=92647 RepID=A0ABX5ML54_9BURK|nr:hypothetical protein [Paraburkholderia tropica]PXX13591.1 hypothetical protein C7400_115160 [Paraburkholderia tropica]PZW78522.1 hypothetical protein C7399_114160 [Paraburkholderia tropica]